MPRAVRVGSLIALVVLTALGAASTAEIGPIMLRRPASVRVTPSHVDVTFPLADHPVAIRLAGLDRDPGFIPAAGRSVAFHFE